MKVKTGFQKMGSTKMSEWIKVVMASDCIPCDMCGEPVCEICEMHYAECDCPGPHQDDMYEYKEENGILYGKLLDEPEE